MSRSYRDQSAFFLDFFVFFFPGFFFGLGFHTLPQYGQVNPSSVRLNDLLQNSHPFFIVSLQEVSDSGLWLSRTHNYLRSSGKRRGLLAPSMPPLTHNQLDDHPATNTPSSVSSASTVFDSRTNPSRKSVVFAAMVEALKMKLASPRIPSSQDFK